MAFFVIIKREGIPYTLNNPFNSGRYFMPTRQVYMIWIHPLFHDSMHLLLRHPDIRFVGSNSDLAAAEKEIIFLRPDTILIEKSREDQSNPVMEILNLCPWTVLVILISLADNQLSMYFYEQRLVGRADELLEIVLR